jgi:hypothetical protein
MTNAFSTPKTDLTSGFYTHGVAYGLAKKMEVAEIYERPKGENGETKALVQKFATEAKVSPKFAHKLIPKIGSGEDLFDPHQESKERIVRGSGSRTFTAVEEAILLRIRNKNPSTPIADYR